MAKTIDMLFIQYINSFERLIGVRTKHCFSYNGAIFFVVQSEFVSRAIGENGINIRKLAIKFRRKIKVIPAPNGTKDIGKFISAIIYPLRYSNINFDENTGEVAIQAPLQARSMIIGRNKKKQEELFKILKEYFNISKLTITG